ncbi:hypothetical protein QR680_012110 [Steinernema hermaphroditum]|uniref:Uncharacterized protein n=1 Tax=Steinernema hermaphroditum TaxID=289476 RepID=A0AA39I0X6_9BILA|nr:hypothetical protein QR680_012110 [Steinernema hermaphroditum]
MNNLNLYFYKHLFQLLQVESVQEVAKLSEGNPIADDAWDFTVAYEPTSLLIAFDFKQRSHCFLYRDESAVDERKLRNVDSLRIDTVSFVFGDAGLHLPKHAKILSGIDEIRCDSSFDEAGKYTLYCFKELVSELPEADWNIEVSMTDCTMADSHWKTKLQRTQSGDFMVILKCGDLETQTINPRNVRKQ